jgi:hypothetical protein
MIAIPVTQETGQNSLNWPLEVASTQTARPVAGRLSRGGDGGIRTPVQNRWPVASYVRSRHFMCHGGLLPTGSRCGEPNCLG